MQLTIDIKESAMDKVMYLLNSLKSDVTIIDKIALDIEPINRDDNDFKYIKDGRIQRSKEPQNYGTIDDIDWD